MSLGEVVKEYRSSHGLSMEAFAKLSGLSKGYISMLEKNKNPQNGKPIAPSLATYENVARAVGISVRDLMEMTKGEDVLLSSDKDASALSPHTIRVPVLGSVVAGIPVEAIEDIIDYEELDGTLPQFRSGTFFGLRVSGRSMEPTLHDGDTVIVHQQPTIESGEIGIILINGDEATVKEVKRSLAGITLIGHNTAVYTPHFYSNEEIRDLPVQILGKVVELRRRF